MSAKWERAPKPGYVVCPYCYAIVEDKGLKRAAHVTSSECQEYQSGVSGVVETGEDT